MAVIEGYLIDAQTGSPVAWTSVWIDGVVATSDVNGYWRLDVPPGTYTLRVRSPVYAPVTMTVSAPGSYTIRMSRITL